MTSACLSLFWKRITLFLYKLFWTWKSLTVCTTLQTQGRELFLHGDKTEINFHYKHWKFYSWYERRTEILNILSNQLKMRLAALCCSGTDVGPAVEAAVHQALLWNPSYWDLCEGISCSPFTLFPTALPREEKTSTQKGKYHCSFIISPGAGLTFGSAAPLHLCLTARLSKCKSRNYKLSYRTWISSMIKTHVLKIVFWWGTMCFYFSSVSRRLGKIKCCQERVEKC